LSAELRRRAKEARAVRPFLNACAGQVRHRAWNAYVV